MYPIIFVILIIQGVIKVSQNSIRAKRYGWKAYKKSYDTFVYSEKIQGTWKKIEISRMYYRGSFYILFKNIKDWKNYPLWAQDRNKIMQRVLISFPDGENQNGINEIHEIGSHLNL